MMFLMFNFLKAAGGAILNQMDKKKERITMYRDRADSYSDSSQGYPGRLF